MSALVAYKLFRRRADGSLGTLFINRKQRIPIGRWLYCESHPTKGYAYRPGWHCAQTPDAPHLKMFRNRVWAKVAVGRLWYLEPRPKSQGGSWLIADRIKILEVL